MNLLPVGEFKAKFSEILAQVKQGASFGITYGKNKKKVAALIPYEKHAKKAKPTLGLLQGKASFKEATNSKITDKEFLSA